MNENGIFRRRDLPHIDVEDKPYFLTGCLDGSLPAAGLKRIRQYRLELDQRKPPEELSEKEWELLKNKLVFKLADRLLDHQAAVTHLKDERLAEIVQNAFLHFANVRYKLYAFVVMPSHHHWAFMPDRQWSERLAANYQAESVRKTPREVISHSIQSYTATMCHRLLELNGRFWQPETFDHYARDEDELLRIIAYIENNPVVAGLARRPADYRWSSAFIREQLGLAAGMAIPRVQVTEGRVVIME